MCNRHDVGIGLMITYHCLLRPGELCRLVAGDIHLGDAFQHLSAPLGIVSIHSSKTQRTGARIQHVTIISENILAYVVRYKKSLPADTQLFPSYAALRRVVTLYLDNLLGKNHGYTLGGLRAGGATFLYLETGNVQWVQRRGRWTAARSLDHYLQEGATLLGMDQWSSDARWKIVKLAATLPPLFSVPPRLR